MIKAVTLLIFIVCISSQFSTSAQTQLHLTLTHDNLQRGYTLYIPASYTGDEAFPLVLLVHGYGSNGANMINKALLKPVADTENFIVLAPDGYLDSRNNPSWNLFFNDNDISTDDVGFIDALLDEVSANYSIDASRVYATGFSFGGCFVYILASTLNHRFAAFAPVEGLMLEDGYYSPLVMVHPTPFLIIHGDKDNNVPIDGIPGLGRSMDDILNYWVGFNNCDTNYFKGRIPNINKTDGSEVEHYAYDNGTDGVSVELLKVVGGQHHWPGFTGQPSNLDINGGEEVWRFFSRFRLVNGEIISTPRADRDYIPDPVLSDIQPLNFSFETGDFTSWLHRDATSVVTNNAHSGTYAAYIDGEGAVEQIISLKPNTTYTISTYGKVAADGQRVFFGVTNNTTNTFIKNHLFTSTEYTQGSISFTTGPEQEDYKIWFWNNQGGGYYVDDFEIYEEAPLSTKTNTKSENQVIISPNPFVDYIKIHSNVAINQIQLVDIRGNVLLTKDYNDGTKIKLPLLLNAGLYFVQVSTLKGIETYKVIKK